MNRYDDEVERPKFSIELGGVHIRTQPLFMTEISVPSTTNSMFISDLDLPLLLKVLVRYIKALEAIEGRELVRRVKGGTGL